MDRPLKIVITIFILLILGFVILVVLAIGASPHAISMESRIIAFVLGAGIVLIGILALIWIIRK
ncbi:hypothetical protein QNI16_21480 [Cytophagaceae bacterium YF14B1]|uniref:Uncharacterized protein n=1 Tax=Xanthocytophaga flava TaxID=3048013 RepID=A0AAE3QTT5_9BACT|nr:hypothetical protein [Xanthocytophaga flavus]MDJ1483085.1 hypothetical protein [Xanthocytophaga flavus]